MSEFIHNGDLARKATKLNLPYSASIEIITKCNFKCEHCYIPEHTEEMSYSTIVSIVDQLKELGVFEIMLTGGEIVMHKEFMEVVKYIRKKGMRTILFSNISLLSEEQIRELAEIYITEISTSLFSLEDAINSSITKTMNSTKMVLDKVRLIKKYNIPLEIKVPVMKKTYVVFQRSSNFVSKTRLK